MRELEEIAVNTLSIAPPTSDFLFEGRHYNRRISGWFLFDCHGLWYNVALIFPSVLFLVFLGLQARKCFTKLCHGRSYVMIAYYRLLWLVSVLNLGWCSLQVWECSPVKEFSWNLLSLFTTSGMLFMEISFVAFLLQGNYASGLQALTRIFAVSCIIVGVDILLKAIYVFGYGIPLFYKETTNPVNWGLWVIHKLLLTAVYGFIVLIYHSKRRERLLAKPAFYNNISVMFCLNAIGLFACGLLGSSGVGLGFWLNNATIICYHAFYLPLLYVTFLSDFFQEEDMHLENVYYSEMKDAGFFEEDCE